MRHAAYDVPLLVFYETTRACQLSCKHCRANAISEPLPGELSTQEALEFIRQLKCLGGRPPVLVLTGGDPLMRKDIWELVAHATRAGLATALSPSVTPLLTKEAILMMARLGLHMVSISLDGARPETHELIRGQRGHFEATLRAAKELVRAGLRVQVNTIVTRYNVLELAHIAKIVKELGASVWEVFFLVKVGRGVNIEDIGPWEYEDVMHFLYDASSYGFSVRTVEGPFFRRVALWRGSGSIPSGYEPGRLYRELSSELRGVLGPPSGRPMAQTFGTRDGNGVVFVAYNGDIYPSGFLPLALGNVRRDSLLSVYRENGLLRSIRLALFKGRCGICPYREVCGGSRARAFATSGDPLHEDPACPYDPRGVAPRPNA